MHTHKHIHTGIFKCTPLLSSCLQSDKLAACWLPASLPPNSAFFFCFFFYTLNCCSENRMLEAIPGTCWPQNTSCSAHTSHQSKIHPHTDHHTQIHTVWSLCQRIFLNGLVSWRAYRELWVLRPHSKVFTLAATLKGDSTQSSVALTNLHPSPDQAD